MSSYNSFYNNKKNSTSILIDNNLDNFIRNSIILKKHVIRNRFGNSSIPNQLANIINDIDWHNTIQSINNFKPKGLIRLNLLIAIQYVLLLFFILCAIFTVQTDYFSVFFPFIFLFFVTIKVTHKIKYINIVDQIETFHIGINESYEKYYNVSFIPHFQKTNHSNMLLDILSPGNYIIEQSELIIEYPVSKFSIHGGAIPINQDNDNVDNGAGTAVISGGGLQDQQQDGLLSYNGSEDQL